MRRPLLLLFIALALTACGRSDKARQELAQMNIEYAESSFIDQSRDGNAAAVKLFLEAGMSPEVRTRSFREPSRLIMDHPGPKRRRTRHQEWLPRMPQR